MKTSFRVVLLFVVGLLAGCFLPGTSSAQTVAGPTGTISQSESDRIVQSFTAKETQFRKALLEYAFKRDALIQELGMGGQVIGEYHRVSHFTFDDTGNRFEKIDYFPIASFEGVTQEDIEDLGGINPFAVGSTQVDFYDFKYVGKERIDELDLYVFDVSPKVMPDAKKTKQRLFLGRVWIDDHDLQIVKSKGKGVPETKKNKFPVVETYREQIDGKYWFPTYSYADEEIVFDNGDVLRIRIRVKYTDYQRASGKLRVIDMEGEAPEPKATPSPTPKRTP
ncbi:MAG: hypothetical protein QOD75_3851 [Blastocatellia bacterium]|jgi:hypothetical protein|nr:hypothetical protein [Blastocatellia bacterium]